MIDREKVIKGLECHQIDNNHRINCTDCPYYVDDDNHIQCVNDLHEDAIALLKEHEAVVPNRGLAKTQTAWFCGSCGFRLNRAGRFCSKCGQAVKWE